MASAGKSGITDAERQQVRDLHVEGKGRNDIARIAGIPAVRVSRIAQELGLSFDRNATAAATAARKADLAARRAQLAETLHDVAERELTKMTQSTKYWSWGGKDHTYDEQWQDEPTPADRRAMMATAGAAIDRSLKLVPPVDASGAEEARSMIGKLAAGIADLVNQDDSEDTDPEEGR